MIIIYMWFFEIIENVNKYMNILYDDVDMNFKQKNKFSNQPNH